MIVIVTDHAYDRAKERLSIKKESLDRLAEKAFNEGLKQSDTTGRVHRYITKLNEKANNIRIYGDNIFIFDDNRLLTVYQLRLDMKLIAVKQQQKRNR